MRKINTIIAGLMAVVKIDDSFKKVGAGTENLDAGLAAMMASKKATLTAGVESILVKGTNPGDTGLKPHQIEAGKIAAIYAVDPLATIQRFGRGRAGPTFAGTENFTFNTGDFIPDQISDVDIAAGVEAFDGQVLNASMFFSVAYNSLVIDIDPVAELFYPVVIMDPTKASYVISTTITNLMKSVKRDISGAPTEFKKESLVKLLGDTDTFTLDANRLYPVLRAESEDKLLTPNGVPGLTREVTVLDGVVIETAPILINTKVDLLGISQTDELLTLGYMDERDSIHGSTTVDNLIFTLTGSNGTDDVTEYFGRALNGLPATFIPTPNGTFTGNSKEMQLDYVTTSLAWVGGDIEQVDGSVTEIEDLAALTAGYTVKVGFELTGKLNTESGTTVVRANDVEMVELLNASGNVVPTTDATYIAIKAIFDTIALVGVDLKAHASNSNERFRGKLLTADTYECAYTVPTRTKVREQYPVNDSGDDNAKGLVAQVDFTRRAISKEALLELNTMSAVLSGLSNDTQDYGISNKLVNKYFLNTNFDLTTIVDSDDSGTRAAAVTEAFKLNIATAANEMYIASNYHWAFTSSYPNAKPTVILGANSNIGRFLPEKWSDSTFNYVLAISNDVELADNLFMSFGIFDATRNKEGNLLNFGNTFYSPESVVVLQRSGNGSVYNESSVHARYKSQTLCPVLTVLSVSGLEAVLGKVTAYRKTV